MMRKKNMNEFASFQDVLSGSQRNASVVQLNAEDKMHEFSEK